MLKAVKVLACIAFAALLAAGCGKTIDVIRSEAVVTNTVSFMQF